MARHFFLWPMLLIGLLLPHNTWAGRGDVFYVKAPRVNVRDGPTTAARMMTQLVHGDKVFEVELRGDWMRVGIIKTGTYGWIHGRLLDSQDPNRMDEMLDVPEVETFRAAIEFLTTQIRKISDIDLFTKVKDRGKGVVAVTATDLWMSAPESDRRDNLNTLFDVWDASGSPGRPITVRIVDSQGRVQMSRSR